MEPRLSILNPIPPNRSDKREFDLVSQKNMPDPQAEIPGVG
jgi:hypothetical protein